MRNKALKICGLTFILGIFGAFLRWAQLGKIIDPDTLLAAPDSPWSYALIAFLVFSIALIALWLRPLRRYTSPQTYPEAFARNLPVYTILAVIIGLVMAVGGAMTIVRSVTIKTSYSVFELLLGVLAFPAAASIAAFIVNANKSGKKTGGGSSTVFIVIFLCFWLIAAYKYSAADPVIWHFALRLLAVSAAILAFYYIAGFVFGKPRAQKSLFFSLLAVLLCTVSLADSYPMGEQLLVLSVDASLLLLSFSQVGCISGVSESGESE